MFSGKTTTLLTKIVLMADIGRPCLYINYSRDHRKDCQTDGTITTHHSRFSPLPKSISIVRASTLSEIEVGPYQVLGLDEGQFYPDIDKVIEWVYSGKIVFISSLDGDYKRRPFEEVLKLISEADTVTKCYAYCRSCLDKGIYTPAPFSKRIVQSEERIVIGGIDSYIPVCRRCL
jgi:thymidine kinase